MNRQPRLFDLSSPDMPAIAHTGDPATSHAAAEAVTESGRRDRHCAIVLGLVRRYPGRTAVELWRLCADDERAALVEMQSVRRRLTDLHHRGLVRQGSERACTVRGSRMVTWEMA